MSELISAKIKSDIYEGLQLKYPDLSFNEIVQKISSDKSRRIYRNVDIKFALEQIQLFRKENPAISIEEICQIIENNYKNSNEKQQK